MMSVFTKLGVNIAAPTDAAGNPRRPVNQDFQIWMTEAERLFYALIAGQGGDIDLPNLLISYTITGGSENAIEAAPNLPVPDAAGEALFSIQIAQDNTGPVTINGKPLLTNSGNEVAAGGLVAGGIYLFLDDGMNYRLVSDQASAAVLAAAEAAQQAAEEARDAAESAVGGVQYPVSYGLPQSLSTSQRLQAQANIGIADFETVSDAEIYVATPDQEFIRTAGYHTPGLGPGLFTDPVETDPDRSDYIEVTVQPPSGPSVQRWYREAQETGRIDLARHGLYGDAETNSLRDETGAFLDAISVMADRGLKGIISPGGLAYKLIEGLIPFSVDIDLGGSKLIGDFNGEYANKTATLLRTQSADNVSVAIRDAVVDGMNLAQAPSANNGVPLLWFDGGDLVELDRVEVLNGANRDATVHSDLLDYTNAEVLIRNPKLVKVKDSRFWSSPGEILQIQSSDASTILQMDRCRFSKTRSHNPAQNYSSSSLNLFNLNSSSYAKGLIFQNHVKSAANILVAGIDVANVLVDGVSDSSGLDFNEASSAGLDQIRVRNVIGRNISGALVRASANSLLAENVKGTNCLYTVRIEGDTSGGSIAGDWIVKAARELTGIVLRDIRGVGGTSGTTDTVISIVGASAALPAHVTVEGGDDMYSGSPLAPIEYGINAQHCNLVLKGGGHREGRTALVRMTGRASFKADDVVFDTSSNGSVATHLLLLDAATVSDVLFRDCKNVGTLNAGASDIRYLNGTTQTGKIYIDRSDTIAVISDATKIVKRDGGVMVGSTAYNPPPISAGGRTSTTVTVVGAKTTDFAFASFAGDLSGLIIEYARVTAADTVTVGFMNPTSSTIDVVPATLTALAIRT